MFRAGLISLVVLMVAGCGASTFKYSGPGSTTDLLNARWDCYRQHKCSDIASFDQCVASRGYVRYSKGRLDASANQLYFDGCTTSKEADRRWDRGVKAFQNLLDTIDKPRREQNEFNRNFPLPTMPSTNYSEPPIDGCLNGTQWMMDSAGRWECQ